MNEFVIQLFPAAALILFIVGEFTQLIKIIRTKAAKDISHFRYFTQIFVGISMSIYYIMNEHYIVLGVQQILLGVAITIFILCQFYKKREKNE